MEWELTYEILIKKVEEYRASNRSIDSLFMIAKNSGSCKDINCDYCIFGERQRCSFRVNSAHIEILQRVVETEKFNLI